MLLVALSLAARAESQRLGRFFSTPEERALLNDLRNNRDLVAPEPEPQAQATVQEPAVEQLTIDGLVIRSGGANSAWVNGRPVSDGWTTREGVRVDATPAGRGGRVKLTLPSGVDTVDLKPGQKIDVESGVVVEGYEPLAPSQGASVFGAPSPGDGVMPDAKTGQDGNAVGAPPATQTDETTRKQILEKLQRALGGG